MLRMRRSSALTYGYVPRYWRIVEDMVEERRDSWNRTHPSSVPVDYVDLCTIDNTSRLVKGFFHWLHTGRVRVAPAAARARSST